MINTLVNYVKGINHTIKKIDVVNTLENTLGAINDDVLPTLDDMIKNSGLTIIQDSPILSAIKYSSGIKAKDNKELLVKIKSIVTNINKAGKNLEKVVNDNLSDVVTDKTISVKDGAILKIISDITSLAMYIMDFNYLILIEGKSDNTDFPKIKLQQIKDGVPAFANILKSYSKDFNKSVNELTKMPSNSLYIEDSKIAMLDKIVSKFSKNIPLPNTKGFINNPIYHIRMWLTDRDVDKYESLKEKRKLIELKLLELKTRQDGENNSKLSKQIEYYENKLSSLEYSIKEFEEESN